ncbi:hypothetical protein FT643_17415 [Ketobacter sp. MCCC 1A13808]|uniref:hypothetical protein n=1 Tax=Ketobacter sp. MCCC 1A13808 TaxID=2602738 RepID=UPI0012EBAC25|nr:hypothetical protein [Ketobacter sp. MCCC 1A13808]MVF13921.1 hypothetical protein [Ketobacter sp. MCCC 1A13808]
MQLTTADRNNTKSGNQSLSRSSVEILLRRILPYYLLFIFITTALAALNGYLTHNDWMMGDWLINYQGGMIRRGLFGEGVFRFSEFTDLSAGLVVLCWQLFLYATYFGFSYLLLKQSNNITAYLLLIFSPFIFTFQINDLQGGSRKEIIVFALLAYAVYAANNSNVMKFRKTFHLILLVYPALILTHEMLAIFLPYFLIVYFYKADMNKSNIAKLFALVAMSIVSFLISLNYSGSLEQVNAIKQSLIDADYALVGGSLDWLAFSTELGLGAVEKFITEGAYLSYYGLAVVLAAVAYLPIRKNLGYLTRNNRITLMLLAIGIGSLALFAVAIDWGRFIYAHLILLFLISLLKSTDKAEYTTNPSGLLSKHKQSTKLITAIGFILYTQFWYIPHCCTPMPIISDLTRANVVSLFQPYVNIGRYVLKVD